MAVVGAEDEEEDGVEGEEGEDEGATHIHMPMVVGSTLLPTPNAVVLKSWSRKKLGFTKEYNVKGEERKKKAFPFPFPFFQLFLHLLLLHAPLATVVRARDR